MIADFLAGLLSGAFAIPMLVRRLATGRWDGWIDGRTKKPPKGTTVLACMPWTKGIDAVTYNGPAGGGDIPEDAPLFWRPMPRRPRFRPNDWLHGPLE